MILESDNRNMNEIRLYNTARIQNQNATMIPIKWSFVGFVLVLRLSMYYIDDDEACWNVFVCRHLPKLKIEIAENNKKRENTLEDTHHTLIITYSNVRKVNDTQTFRAISTKYT